MITNGMVAKCGHDDMLGYLSNSVCGKCAKDNHRKAMGVTSSKRRKV